MRSPTVAATSLVAATLLFLGWHEGSRTATGELAGVHVVAAPPASQSTRPKATASRPARKQNAKQGSKQSKQGSKQSSKQGSKQPARQPTPAVQHLTGATVSTPYGDVQVEAVLQGGRLTDVRPLHLTDSSDRSVSISADAAPVLRSEALAAQSAKIDTVSGATYTSEAYRQSLQAVLDQAHL